MNFSEIISKIKHQLSNNLPGELAHVKMAPVTRKEQLKFVKDYSKAQKAAVLILLYLHENNIYIPFIKRPEYDGVHSGQIAFPGGKIEKSDNDLTETALREADEETGIKTEDVTILGYLSDLYVPPSNFLVTPVLGYSEKKPLFKTDKTEVAGLFNFLLEDILDKHNRSFESVLASTDRSRIKVPCFRINQQIIWGATAMILMEFVSLFRTFTQE